MFIYLRRLSLNLWLETTVDMMIVILLLIDKYDCLYVYRSLLNSLYIFT